MRLAVKTGWVSLALLIPIATPAQAFQVTGQVLAPTAFEQAQSDDTTTIPKFHAESRQVVVASEVWKPVDKKNAGDLSWIPEEALAEAPKGTSLRRILEHLPPAAKGLNAGDFHVFDNGVEQRINYFKEADFPAVASTTVSWRFDATTRGIWGTLMFASGVPYTPSATYLIGYIPPALRPGECRTIQIVVPNHYVYTNRKQYCKAQKPDAATTVEATKLAARMESFANSSRPGAMEVSVQTSTFWSSGVLALARQTPSTENTTANAPILPATDFTYTVEVHDSKAPATVQITTQFGLVYQLWDHPCRKSSAIHVLGMIYKGNGELEGQFGDTFRCDMWARTPEGEVIQKFPGAKGIIPTLFDTQVELLPGEYELRVVVSDGKNFGRARAALRVEPLRAEGLTLSDVALNSVLRDASWVVRDATDVTPAPIVPTPLVSKNVQFLPVADTQLRKDNPLSIYFEIYKPPNLDGNAVYYRIRITDLNTGAIVMNTDPISAAEFFVPGSGVIPIGLKLSADKLAPGSYRLEVQASDSTRRETKWQAGSFDIR